MDSNQLRVERIVIDGQVLWIKRSEGDKTKYWYWLQMVLSRLTACEILRSAASRGGSGALQRDVSKLAAFRAAGFHVPEIVYDSPNALVTSDIGVSLQQIRSAKEISKKDLTDLYKKAAGALGRLHAAGLVHGRPLLRDLTWDGECIGFLDLEEMPETVMALPAAKARDVLLFFVQLARSRDDAFVLPHAFDAYRPYLSAEITKQLLSFFRRISPVVWLIGPLLRRYGGRDGLSTILALDFLHNALSKEP